MVAKNKKAIAMIELIFALVIMGIVLMSAPMLIQQSVRSGNVALQQEAIAAAAAQASIVLSMHWDEANSNLPIGASPILDTNRTNLDFNDTTPPLGLVGVSSRNSNNGGAILSPSNNLGADFTDNNDTNETDYSKFDDVDDFNGQSFGVTVFNNEITTTDKGDYVDKNISITTDINYADDTITFKTDMSDSDIATIDETPFGGGISNIKFVKVNLTSNSNVEELNKSITFQAFSSNIGTFLPEDRGEL